MQLSLPLQSGSLVLATVKSRACWGCCASFAILLPYLLNTSQSSSSSLPSPCLPGVVVLQRSSQHSFEAPISKHIEAGTTGLGANAAPLAAPSLQSSLCHSHRVSLFASPHFLKFYASTTRVGTHSSPARRVRRAFLSPGDSERPAQRILTVLLALTDSQILRVLGNREKDVKVDVKCENILQSLLALYQEIQLRQKAHAGGGPTRRLRSVSATK